MSSTRSAFKEFIFRKAAEYESKHAVRTEMGFLIFLLSKLSKAARIRFLKRIRLIFTNDGNRPTTPESFL